MRRKLSMVLIASMLFSLLPVLTAPTQAAPTGGARAAFGGNGGTELFLGGNYIELGISNWGDFGTEGSKPSNFRGTSGPPGVGMSADHDGYSNGYDFPVDYYLPGTPEERFAVGYKVGTTTSANSNSAVMGAKNMPTVVTNNSDTGSGLLKATIVSTWLGKMEITQVISFKENDKFYRNDVTIKNLTDQAWDGARYMRSLDPDNTVFQGGQFETNNTVTHTVAEDGMAVVKAETYDDNDKLYKTFGSRAPIFFYSSDPAAKASVFGFSNSNPYIAAAYDTPAAKGVLVNGDIGITMTWDSGALSAGQSKSFTYYTSLDERDFSEVIADIELDEGGSAGVAEADANDGTVAGNQKAVISGAVLKETIDKNHVRVNNLPAGLDFEVTRLSSTELDITFTGAAVQHSSEFSVDNASITIEKENLVDLSYDLTTETFEIPFRDPAVVYVNEGVVTEAVYGSGNIDGTLTLTLLNGKFAEDIADSDVSVNNLPVGMEPTVTWVTYSEIEIGFTGTAEVLDDVVNASVTIAADKLIGSAADVTTNTFKIDFHDPEPFLIVQKPVLYESADNDGSFEDAIVLQLTNGTFGDAATVASSVYGYHFPEGLSIGDVVRDSDTKITIYISGTAESATVTDNVYNARIGIDKTAITSSTHGADDEVSSNTFSILFRDPPPKVTVAQDIVRSNDDGSVTEALTVTLKNGTFKADVSGGVTVNNLPEGLGISVERISSTELLISFTGIATKQNVGSKFASVTIDQSIVNEAASSMTSNSFEIDAPRDITLVNLDKTALSWDVIKQENTNTDEVKTNLNLMTAGSYDTVITWTSSNGDVIGTDGTVRRPSYEEGDQPVVLTATITKGTVTETVEFFVIVKKLVETDAQKVNEAKSELTWDTIRQENEFHDNVTTDLNLVTVGSYGVAISWTSSNETVIGTDGTVSLPEINTDVTLTATLTLGEAVAEKTFDLTVVVDSVDPVITLNGESAITLERGKLYVEPGVRASDNRDGDISGDVKVIGFVNTDRPGTYTLTYRVEDSSGNVTEVQRVITVVEAAVDPNAVIPAENNERVPDSEISDAIEGVKQSDTKIVNIVVDTDVTTGTPVSVVISKRQVENLKRQDIKLLLETGNASIEVPISAVNMDLLPNNARLALVIEQVDTADPENQEMVDAVQNVNSSMRIYDNRIFDFFMKIIEEDADGNVVSEEPIENFESEEDIKLRILVGTVDDDTKFMTFYYNVGKGEWEYIRSEYSGSSGFVTLLTNHLSIYSVMNLTKAQKQEEMAKILNKEGVTIPEVLNVIEDPDMEFEQSAVDLYNTLTQKHTEDVAQSLIDAKPDSGYNYANLRTTYSDVVEGKNAEIAGDTVQPVITLKGPAEYIVYLNAAYTEPGATASDNQDGDITGRIVIHGTVDTTQIGDYVLRYTVIDLNGNETEVVRTVRVVERSDDDDSDHSAPSNGGGPKPEVDVVNDLNPVEVVEGQEDIKVEPIDSTDLQPQVANMKLIGTPYKVESTTTGGVGEGLIRIQYNPEEVMNEDRLAVYVYDEAQQAWKALGGVVDKANNVITVEVEAPSRIAVMEYNKTFNDLEGHWSKDIVEMLASRQIIDGDLEGNFNPHMGITRAEVAALITRTLQLPTPERETGFTDIGKDEWYADYIAAARQTGIVKGVSETEYEPSRIVTRQEMTAMIVRAYKYVEDLQVSDDFIEQSEKFEDTQEISDWAEEDVYVAKSLEIVEGRDKNNFAPKADTLRGEAAALIYNLLKVLGKM